MNIFFLMKILYLARGFFMFAELNWCICISNTLDIDHDLDFVRVFSYFIYGIVCVAEEMSACTSKTWNLGCITRCGMRLHCTVQ